jgi:hypothetical protein
LSQAKIRLLSETNAKLNDAREYLAGMTAGGKTRKAAKQILGE